MDCKRSDNDTVDFRSQEPVYRQLARILRQQVLTGQLPAGTKLPERTLAKKYRVTRTTVRSTLYLLGAQGLIRRAPRKGTVVAEIDIDGQRAGTMPTILVREGVLEATGPAGNNDWYSNIYIGIQKAAQEMGYDLRKETVTDPVRVPLQDYVAPSPSQAGGVILYGTFDEQYMSMFRSEGVPLVVVDYWTHDMTTDCAAVDIEGEAYTLVEYLARQHHTSLGFVALGRLDRLRKFQEYDPDIPRMLDHLRRAAQRRRIEVRDEWVLLVPTTKHLRHAIAGYLTTQPRPKAILCFEAESTAVVLEAAERLGLQCPRDFSLVGRDAPMIRGRQVTSLVNDPQALGRLAVRLLSEQMYGLRSRAAKMVLSSQLMPGDTTGPAPC